MNQHHQTWSMKTKQQERSDQDRERAQFEYRQAIFDLLKEPVSLGIASGTSNHGRQR